METTKKPAKRYLAELREHASERASEWTAMRSIAENVGSVRPRRCGCGCARQSVTGGERAGMSADERARLQAVERREVRELRQANEILRQASAYFAAAELDRWSKP